MPSLLAVQHRVRRTRSIRARPFARSVHLASTRACAMRGPAIAEGDAPIGERRVPDAWTAQSVRAAVPAVRAPRLKGVPRVRGLLGPGGEAPGWV